MAKRNKKTAQDFSKEYGVYKVIHPFPLATDDECEYVLVKRGFYDVFHARKKANTMWENAMKNGIHLVSYTFKPIV